MKGQYLFIFTLLLGIHFSLSAQSFRKKINEQCDQEESHHIQAKTVITKYYEALRIIDIDESITALLQVMHKSNGNTLQNYLHETVLQDDFLKARKSARKMTLPIELFSYKLTTRSELGFPAYRTYEEGEEYQYRVEDNAGKKSAVLVFFPKGGGAATVSSMKK